MDENALIPSQLKFVLLVVLLICGGNGVGIIAAALIWKFTGSVAGAVLTAVAITVVALIGALALVLLRSKKAGRK